MPVHASCKEYVLAEVSLLKNFIIYSDDPGAVDVLLPAKKHEMINLLSGVLSSPKVVVVREAAAMSLMALACITSMKVNI